MVENNDMPVEGLQLRYSESGMVSFHYPLLEGLQNLPPENIPDELARRAGELKRIYYLAQKVAEGLRESHPGAHPPIVSHPEWDDKEQAYRIFSASLTLDRETIDRIEGMARRAAADYDRLQALKPAERKDGLVSTIAGILQDSQGDGPRATAQRIAEALQPVQSRTLV